MPILTKRQDRAGGDEPGSAGFGADAPEPSGARQESVDPTPERSCNGTSRHVLAGRPIARYALQKLGAFLLVIWAVFTLSFVLLYALPGDPVALMIERRSQGAGGGTQEQLDALRAHYGVDQPLIARYFMTLGQFLRGDLGLSFQSGRSTADLIASVAPSTIALGVAALAVAIPFSVTLALLTSRLPGGVLHRLLINVPAVIAAIPAFWLGLLLLQLFSFHWRVFPSAGSESPAGLVLPTIALALPVSAALTVVLVRSLDDLHSAGFVALLRARGLPERRVYLAHIVRNALLPFITLSGLTVGGVLVGTVVTETVFSRSGLGRLLVSSVESQDVPVVLAITVLAAVLFGTVNLLVDLAYPLIDPRLRRRRAGIA